MIAYFYTHQMVVVFVAIFIFMAIIYFLLKFEGKSKGAVKKQKDNKVNSQPAPKDVPKTAESEIQVAETSSEKDSEDKQSGDKKPKITHIYERKESEVKPVSDEVKEYEYKDVEFVNTSKNIAKFKSFVEKSNEENVAEIVDINQVDEIVKNNDLPNHFDHSKRLKNMISDGEIDNLFASHLSDKNIDRHLRSDNEINLYSRANKTTENSFNRISAIGAIDLDDQNYGDELLNLDSNIDAKTMFIADAIANRKSHGNK